MKIIVTGGNGTMGKALREFLPDAVYLSRQELDVTKPETIQQAFEQHRPDVVIHAAAITDHQHPNASEIIETNIIGTEYVARYTRTFSAKLVYLSTHYVYPGETGNYKETDETCPIGTYAWSKLAGEGWAATVPEHLIIRGSWYTPETRLNRWLDGAIVDAYCNRESARSAAAKIARLVRAGASGVYNIGGKRRTFLEILVDEGLGPEIAYVKTRAQASYRAAYPFPADSSVNTDRYEALVAGR